MEDGGAPVLVRYLLKVNFHRHWPHYVSVGVVAALTALLAVGALLLYPGANHSIAQSLATRYGGASRYGDASVTLSADITSEQNPPTLSDLLLNTVQGSTVVLIFWSLALTVAVISLAIVARALMLQRQREIRLIRRLGATEEQVRKSLVAELLLLGIVASCVGIGLGILGSLWVLTSLGFAASANAVFRAINWVAVFGVFIASVLATLLAGLPAARAAGAVFPLTPLGSTYAQESRRSLGWWGRLGFGLVAVIGSATAMVILTRRGARRSGSMRLGGASSDSDAAWGTSLDTGLLIALVLGPVLVAAVAALGAVIFPAVLGCAGRLWPSASARLAKASADRASETASTVALAGVSILTEVGFTVAVLVGLASAQQGLDLANGVPAAGSTVADGRAVAVLGWILLGAMLAATILAVLISLGVSLSWSVRERTRYIGLLRALGVPSRRLAKLLGLQAFRLSLTAAILGVPLGVLLGWVGAAALSPALGELRLVIPWWQLALVLLVTAAAAVATSWVPIRRATKTDLSQTLSASPDA